MDCLSLPHNIRNWLNNSKSIAMKKRHNATCAGKLSPSRWRSSEKTRFSAKNATQREPNRRNARKKKDKEETRNSAPNAYAKKSQVTVFLGCRLIVNAQIVISEKTAHILSHKPINKTVNQEHSYCRDCARHSEISDDRRNTHN
jgi:hypothetical protein